MKPEPFKPMLILRQQKRMRHSLYSSFIVTFFFIASLGCQSTPELTTQSLGLMQVKDGTLQDEYGRQWLLRGINARIEGLFDVSFDDGRTRLEPIPEFAANDAQEMAALGFNLLRLPINWSGLEPQEGNILESYLEKIDFVVQACRDAGIYVLIDFHQDAYSKEIGEDGGPAWAIVSPYTPLDGPLHDLNGRRISEDTFNAFEAFFLNQDNIQDRFMPAWKTVTSRYNGQSEVVGFEVMNEPVVFHVNDADENLYAFYEKAAAAMREGNPQHTLWLEPDSIRNMTLKGPIRSALFNDDNVVYTPHLYPSDNNMDTSSAESWAEGLKQTFDWMQEEADSWGAALVLGEWGIHPNSTKAENYIRAVNMLSNERHMGWAFWLWKEHTQGHWGFYDHSNNDDGTISWSVRADAVKEIAAPYALAVPGKLLEHHFSPDTQILTLGFKAKGNEGAPLLFVSSHWYPQGAKIEVFNEKGEPHGKSLNVMPGGHPHDRVLLPWDGDKGTFSITIAPL